MKVAIQGHPTRGKEVIQILKSLGGKSPHKLYGGGKDCEHYYYIDSRGIIVLSSKYDLHNCKFYTLEEFEKEFPFKIGDVVQTKPCGEPAEVIGLYPNPACIIAYKVRYKSGKEMQHCPENIKFYEEMKEERNITLTLEKAKEWYKKGGELKEIALQAFSEEELNPSTEYIDLGLPSGTLWADTNEEGYYSYQEAIDTFGKNNLPKITDFAELYDYCKWEWNSKSKSMIVTGPNGKYIMLPVLGYRNYEDGRLHFVGDVSYYWSVTPSGIYAYSMYFNNIYSSVNLLNYSNRAYGFSIRKIKRK